MCTLSYDASRLFICTICYRIHGTVEIDDVEFQQECSCTARTSDIQPAPGFDFTSYLELCYCCGLELIPGGSRYSSFFCDRCLEALSKVRDSNGIARIPLARHTYCNGITITAEELDDQEKVELFTTRTNAFFARIDVLEDWRKLSTARRISEFGLKGPIPLPLGAFLTKAEEVNKVLIKERSLHKLLTYFEVLGYEPVALSDCRVSQN
jgi:hypothetical protein